MVRAAVLLLTTLGLAAGCAERVAERAVPAPVPAAAAAAAETPAPEEPMAERIEKVEKPEEAWRRELSPEEFRVLREKGTERAFTGKYWDHHEVGTYACRACGLELFRSDAKFDSGCGWPSFFEPLAGARLTETRDASLGMVRTEITCSRCGSHLGHVFPDGPPPTGLRYCINSVSIQFDGE